jgi:hypothetical protein
MLLTESIVEEAALEWRRNIERKTLNIEVKRRLLGTGKP